MINPIELRENTFLIDNHYPLNLFLNQCHVGEAGRTALYLHWHDHFEFIYMAAGSVSFHIDGQQYDASPGDILFVPSGALHVGYAATNEEIQYWALVFNRSLLEGDVSDPIHGRYLTPYLLGKIRFPVKINDSMLLTPIREMFDDIISEFEKRTHAYELIVKAKIYLLFAILARNYLQEQESYFTDSYEKRMERFKSLILYIQEHIGEKLSLSEAARFVNLTPNHFCNLFKAATGLTFIDYVNRLRVDEAERLLRKGYSVTETANRVGCANLNYFTKLYKKIKGVTPSETKRLPGRN